MMTMPAPKHKRAKSTSSSSSSSSSSSEGESSVSEGVEAKKRRLQVAQRACARWGSSYVFHGGPQNPVGKRLKLKVIAKMNTEFTRARLSTLRPVELDQLVYILTRIPPIARMTEMAPKSERDYTQKMLAETERVMRRKEHQVCQQLNVVCICQCRNGITLVSYSVVKKLHVSYKDRVVFLFYQELQSRSSLPLLCQLHSIITLAPQQRDAYGAGGLGSARR